MFRVLLLLLLASFTAANFAAHAGGPALALAPQPITVEIRDMKYFPGTLTIASGTKVTWINKDDMPHTVTDRGRTFGSAGLDTGDSFSYTFTTPGEFTYFCAVHPFMVAKVVVKPAGS